jgi:hypothetical protein
MPELINVPGNALLEAHRRAVTAAGLDPTRLLRDAQLGPMANTITVTEYDPETKQPNGHQYDVPIDAAHPWYGR